MSCEFDDLDAASWVTAYVKQRGDGSAVLRRPPPADSTTPEPTARPGADSPQLDVDSSTTARALVIESFTADLIVTSSRTAADRTLALAVAASARCPVVAVPSGATWRDDLPTSVGTTGDHLSKATLRSAFALARVLGTGVRAICCTHEPPIARGQSTSTARAAAAAVAECARRYPDVPVDTRVARSHPVTGLIRHARLAALLVIGCTPTTDESTSRRLLDRCPTPIALVGPHVTRTR
ncbi:nucleotide-binding universal stress UspA family protein [Saccharothrix tamanrassetensis]|uniref:Nucleotide-binding universal stress UspA family protein n=1 Tax=Saccharothrix tamanrassetensis TaxID=1051531 RepID=A0A841CJ20_9PSEU|nr:universal stress protein [Saccharothrix tamanrassetensis]MBB5958472.1 nucleotide-binding universal stress UspA family protein [Saccharothrix tamanrassetensis]